MTAQSQRYAATAVTTRCPGAGAKLMQNIGYLFRYLLYKYASTGPKDRLLVL